MLPLAQHSCVTVVCHCVPKAVLSVSAKTVTVLDIDINGMNIGSLHVVLDSPCAPVLWNVQRAQQRKGIV